MTCHVMGCITVRAACKDPVHEEPGSTRCQSPLSGHEEGVTAERTLQVQFDMFIHVQIS